MDSLERLLQDLLDYAEKGLTIDELMANRIQFFLKHEQDGRVIVAGELKAVNDAKR